MKKHTRIVAGVDFVFRTCCRRLSPALPVLCFILFPGVSTVFSQKKAIYTMFLETNVPGNGTEVAFNTPVLRWPYQKGKQVRYDVQLSQDSSFPVDNTIAANALTGAMFNSHRSLPTGAWYWRHRVAGKKWSPVNYFIVRPDALPMVSPVPATLLSNIPDMHPRILTLRPGDDLKKLSKQKEALAIIADAEKALKERVLTEADATPAAKGADAKQEKKINQDAVVALGNRVNQLVLSLCEAYLLTGDKKYASKAMDFGLEVARWDPAGVSGSADFMDGISMYNMALVFDTFYDILLPDQRKSLQDAISHRASRFYKSWVNNIESKVLSGHVWQYILNEFFKSSIALYKHDPAAGEWLAYAYELFLGRAPVLGGLDGGWGEGAYYLQLNMEMLLEIPDKIKNYTGFDFIKTHPWYNKQADWMIYQFPAGSSADGYGDNTEELHAPPPAYESFAIEMARLTGNPKYLWYVEKLRQHGNNDLTQEKRMRWFRLTHADILPLPAVPDTAHFAMAHMSRETGVASMHTTPANTATDIMVAMRSSPYGAYGHILADQNTFNVLVGGKRLFYRTGYKVAMDDPHRLGWSKHTKSMNGILIDGEGQPYSAEAYGNFSRFLQGEQMAYLKGDASNAYQSTETKEDYGVNKFLRHILLLKPNIIVVYDELESQADASWSWLVHSLEHMKLDSAHNTFTASIAGVKGIGKLWSSSPVNWHLTNKFEIPAVNFRNYPGRIPVSYDDTQWHLKATNAVKTPKMRFLNIIQVVKGEAKPVPFKEMAAKGITKVVVGNWEISASLAGDLPPSLDIRSLAGTTAFSAYGKTVTLNGKEFTGNIAESSKLVDMVNGKTRFAETGDHAVSPIR